MLATAEFVDLTPARRRMVRQLLDEAKAYGGTRGEQACEGFVQRRRGVVIMIVFVEAHLIKPEIVHTRRKMNR